MNDKIDKAKERLSDRVSLASVEIPSVAPVFGGPERFKEALYRSFKRAQAQGVDVGERVAGAVRVEVETAGKADGIGREEAAQRRRIEAVAREVEGEKLSVVSCKL